MTDPRPCRNGTGVGRSQDEPATTTRALQWAMALDLL